MGGIFFQYDISALKFIIKEERTTIFNLVVKVASSIGGLFILFSKYINFNLICGQFLIIYFFQMF